MIALFRFAKSGPSDRNLDAVAGSLFALTLIFMLAPGARYLLPDPWNRIASAVQVGLWIADWVFLLVVTRPATATQTVTAAPVLAQEDSDGAEVPAY